jgi:nucleoside-diphosphate-sugar epimerase
MRVLVLGGTGAMGVHLVQLLAEKEIETIVSSRTIRKASKNIKYIQGNAKDINFLKGLLNEKWDAIVDFMKYTTSSFNERVNLLLNATTQYIFLSSSRVYTNEIPIEETSPRLLDVSKDQEYLITDEYALTKARQEDILRNSGKNNWTIIRPYITYSENRLQLGALEKEEWLYRAIHGRTIVLSKDINEKKTTLTYGLDVSKGILAIIGNFNALGEIFHITLSENGKIMWKDILELYINVLETYLGINPKILFVGLDSFLECKPAKYQVLYDRLYDRIFDNTKISKYISTKSFIETHIGLQHCLETFLKNPQFKNINWKTEALKDKLTKEHTPLDEIKGGKQKIKYLIYRYL